MTNRFTILGVAGCGKTSVEEALTARRGWASVHGDAPDPRPDIEKRSPLEPLAPLDTQFAAPARPDGSETGVAADITRPIVSLVQDIIRKLEVRAT